MVFKNLKSNVGQTSVEYMLVVAVSIGLGMTFYKKMDTYFIKSPNSFISKSLNQFKNSIGRDESGRYQRFDLLRLRR